MLNKIRTAGYSAAFGIIVGLIVAAVGVPSMGVATTAITYITKKLVGAMLGQVNPYKESRKSL